MSRIGAAIQRCEGTAAASGDGSSIGSGGVMGPNLGFLAVGAALRLVAWAAFGFADGAGRFALGLLAEEAADFFCRFAKTSSLPGWRFFETRRARFSGASGG